nr:RNA-dependent RNA polymerase [Erysiphe necator associated ourmia-like virus 62]
MSNKQSHTQVTCRACPRAQRTAKNLSLVSEVLRREGLVTKTFIAGGPHSCESLEVRWKEWTSASDNQKGEDRFRFLNAIKGTKTLFDEPCKRCDKVAAEKAIRSWGNKALFTAQQTEPEVLADIRTRTRRIMGKNWWKGTKGRVYVPDQQGCLEMERGLGGTLSVAPVGSDLDSKYTRLSHDPDKQEYYRLLRGPQQMAYEEERVGSAECRVGTAKSKGKLRVVTMQSASMKRDLRPVHEQAYNRLSSRPWLVRGDVTQAHFESLRSSLYRGHTFNSGDYEESTNNLNVDAVIAVVETLSESLPKELGETFVKSFKECEVWWYDGKRKVTRGSMMGNLGSFVVLCILNRICFERALKLAGYDRTHPCLLNGDDILFPGCDGLYYSWLHCTKEVGFVINLKKTMRSTVYGDLNSQTYRYDKGRFVHKFCFGFLGSDSWKEPVGSLAVPLFDLCRQLRFSNAAWLLTTYPVRKLLARVPIPLSSFPRRWWGYLVKKKWFRGLVDQVKPTEVIQLGTERKLPFVLGPPINSSPKIERQIKEAENEVTADYVRSWQGIPVCPIKEKVPHGKLTVLRSRFRLKRVVLGWRRLWLAPVLEALQDNLPEVFVSGYPDWVDEQPGLQLEYKLSREWGYRPPKFSPPLPPSYHTVVGPHISYRVFPYTPEFLGVQVRERMWNSNEMDK